MLETKSKPAFSTRRLAFTVVKVDGGLYAVQIVKFDKDRVISLRTGAGTSIGHASCEASDLLTHYHLYEPDADTFFRETRMV